MEGRAERPQEPGAAAAASRQAIARNFGAFAIAQIVVRFAGLGVIVFVARELTSEDFGRYSVAFALSTMLTLVVELGMGNFIVREGTQSPARLGAVLGHVLVIQASLGMAAIVACAVIGLALHYDATTFLSLILLAIASIVTIAQRSLMAVLVSLDRARASAAFQSVQALVQGILSVAVAAWGGGPVGISAAVLATAVLSWPAAQWLLRRHWSLPVRFERADFWRTLSIGAAYSAVRLGHMLLTYLDTIMVQAIKGNVAAAQYSAAYRLMLAIMMVPGVYTDAVTQPVAQLSRTDRHVLSNIYGRAASQLVIIGLPIAIGGAVLARPIVSAVFGPAYGPAGPAAALLFLGLVLAFPAQLMAVMALTLGREGRVAIVFGVTLVVNAASNAVLIPALGTQGAAAAMLVSNVMLFLGLGRLVLGVGLRPQLGSRLIKAALAAGGMSATLLATRELPLSAAIAVGAVTYALLIVLLRTLDSEDLELLPLGGRLRWLTGDRSPRCD